METILVRSGDVVIGTITRSPRQHRSWQSVTYKGKRYQLFGGPFTYAEYRIQLDLPIKGRRQCQA